MLSQIGFQPALIWMSLSAAMAPTVSWLRWLWIGLVIVAIVRCLKTICVLPEMPEDAANAAACFGGTALIAGLIGFLIFLRIAKMPTQIWVFFAAHDFCRSRSTPRSRTGGALAVLALRVCDPRARLPARHA